MIFLDTHGLCELTRSSPSAQVIAWLAGTDSLLAVPTIALAELRYGNSQLPNGYRRSSPPRFWEITCEHFRTLILSFSKRTASVYGDIAAVAEHKGGTLNAADVQIALIAPILHETQVAIDKFGDFGSSGASPVNPRD